MSTATTTTREFLSSLRFHYHHYRHAEEAVDNEIRFILGGERVTPKRLKRLIATRDRSMECLMMYLSQITKRMADDDAPLRQRLQEYAEKARLAATRPLIRLEDEE